MGRLVEIDRDKVVIVSGVGQIDLEAIEKSEGDVRIYKLDEKGEIVRVK